MKKIIALSFVVFSSGALSGVNKCTDATGNISYQSEACPKSSNESRIDIYNNFVYLEYLSPAQKKPISLVFEKIDVQSFLELMADFLEIHIVATESISGVLNISYKNVPAEKVINDVLNNNGWAYIFSNNQLIIGTHREIYPLMKDKEYAGKVKNEYINQ